MAERDETPEKLIGSIPFGSVKPNTVTTVMPDIGEKLTIPYGSLKTTSPAPGPTPSPSAPQAPPPAPPPKSQSKA